MNIAKLKGKMAEAGISQRKLAKITGISLCTINSRMTGKTEFNADEIISVCDLLGITSAEEKVEIFLTRRSTNGTKND